MRMPTESLERSLPQILEGVLLWAEDPKNKFKLKVSWRRIYLVKKTFNS